MDSRNRIITFKGNNFIKLSKIVTSILVCMLVCLSLSGCSADKRHIVLTTGFEKDELFLIEDITCTIPEFMVYLINTQNQYENVYGKQIWEQSLPTGETLESEVKETVLADIARIKSMNLLARQRDISLNDSELEVCKAAGEKYYKSLNAKEVEVMQITPEIIESLYEEYLLADKVYRDIISEINPEISDDEARTITVQHILFKTYMVDGTGTRVPYTQKAKSDAYELAKEVLEQAREGVDFEELIQKYSEDATGTHSFGKGEMEENFERAAFSLETGEISDIIESEYGYHIIKCVNTFNREETDINKQKIVEQRREEVFGTQYEAFVDGLLRKLNDSAWENIHFVYDDDITTKDFFEVYEQVISPVMK